MSSVESLAVRALVRRCERRGFGDRGSGEARVLVAGEERKRGRPKEDVVVLGLRLKDILKICQLYLFHNELGVLLGQVAL
jgi:hypothetical protein